MLFSVCPAQADTTGWDRTHAGLQPLGSDHTYTTYAFSAVLPNEATEKRSSEIVALNTSEDTAPPPETGETAAKPEFDSFWAWLWDYLYNGASITLGVGLRQSELQVTRKSDGDYGKIVQRDEEAYFISYSTRPTFFKKSKFAYTFMLNYSTFNMDKQETSKDVFEDLGTRVKGDVAYIVPAFFYQWGEHRRIGKFARIGIGLGVGVTRFKGNIELSGPTTVSVSDGSYDLDAAFGIFMEARYRHWGIRISAAGPSFEDDEYKYSVSDIAMNLGYSYYF